MVSGGFRCEKQGRERAGMAGGREEEGTMGRRTEAFRGLKVLGHVGQTVGSWKLDSGSAWLSLSGWGLGGGLLTLDLRLLGSARRGPLLEWASVTDCIGDSLVTCEPERIAMPLLDIDPSFLNKTNKRAIKMIQFHYVQEQGKQREKGSY